MKIEANLNNVKEIETLPGGVYNVFICSEPRFVTSAIQKTPGIEFEFKFTDPGTEIAPGVPRTKKQTIYKSEAMGWEHFKMKEICEACGVKLENPDTADFINAHLKVALSQETYDAKDGTKKLKNEIQYYLKP